MWPAPTGVLARPCFSASSRAPSRPASERLRMPSSGRAAALAPANSPSRVNAATGASMPSTRFCSRSRSGIWPPIGSAAVIRTPWLPSAKSNLALPQVTSVPSAEPKPRSGSSLIAPVGSSRLASCATCRRCGSAGPNVMLASSAPLAAPNNLAPTGLAHQIRAPSLDHSHAGSALVACTASRGSPSPSNWNSALFIAGEHDRLV